MLGVFVGGGLGTFARWSLSMLIVPRLDWPWTTWSINVSGAFALGTLVSVLSRISAGDHSSARIHALRACLGTGLLGGFTTYSTFSFETVGLLNAGHLWLGLGYAISSVFAGGAAAFAGLWVGRLHTKGARR